MKKRKILFSGLLSIAAFGLFTNVNAAMVFASDATLPEKFTTNAIGRVNDAFVVDDTKDAVLANGTIASLNGSSGNNVIDYHSTTGLKPFCIDRTKQYDGGIEYTKGSEVSDYGIIYIIKNASDYYDLLEPATATANVTDTSVVAEMEVSWMTQIALWQYLDTSSTFVLPKGTDGIETIDVTIHDGTANASATGNYYVYSNRPAKLWAQAKKLASDAKTAINPANSISTLTFDFDGSYELNKDTKTIKTGLISSSDILKSGDSFSIDLSSAPENTKIYSEDGTEIDPSNISAKKFYLEFPVDNVENYSFDFDVTAKFTGYTYYTAYNYTTTAKTTTGESYQPLVLLNLTAKTLNGAINFKGSYVEDTASMISRSIYFIGFLILVAGVGMIYVNVKPNESKK